MVAGALIQIIAYAISDPHDWARYHNHETTQQRVQFFYRNRREQQTRRLNHRHSNANRESNRRREREERKRKHEEQLAERHEQSIAIEHIERERRFRQPVSRVFHQPVPFSVQTISSSSTATPKTSHQRELREARDLWKAKPSVQSLLRKKVIKWFGYRHLYDIQKQCSAKQEHLAVLLKLVDLKTNIVRHWFTKQTTCLANSVTLTRHLTSYLHYRNLFYDKYIHRLYKRRSKKEVNNAFINIASRFGLKSARVILDSLHECIAKQSSFMNEMLLPLDQVEITESEEEIVVAPGTEPVKLVRRYLQVTRVFAKNRECPITLEPIYEDYLTCVRCQYSFDASEHVLAYFRDYSCCPLCRMDQTLEEMRQKSFAHENHVLFKYAKASS